MADITLAEYQGRCWLVAGDEHIDGLLGNMLDPEITIEIVPCASKADVIMLWTATCAGRDFVGEPWMIHPGVVNRVKGVQQDRVVRFAEWSAALDDEAKSTIAAAAAWARDNISGRLELIEFVAPDAGRSVGDLQRLRCNLIEDALVRDGVASARIGRQTVAPAEPGPPGTDGRRIDIAARPAAG